MRKKPEAAPRHRAPNGQSRVPILVRLRRDLRDWLDARSLKAGNTRALELEIVLDEARLNDRKSRS